MPTAKTEIQTDSNPVKNQPLFQIKHRFSASVMFACELSAEIAGQSYSMQLGFAVRKAVEAKSYLRDADLRGADLRGADLRGAYLRGAYLRDADLSDADLRDADLSDADLRGADLSDADLRGADLSGADLRGANLSGADLSAFKQDLIAEVLRVPDEIDGLRLALVEGRIDGSTYTGECACLAGTVAHLRNVEGYDGEDIPVNGFDFHADSRSPRERWFMMIRKGNKPETNQAAQIALEWIDEAIAIRNHIRAVAKVS